MITIIFLFFFATAAITAAAALIARRKRARDARDAQSFLDLGMYGVEDDWGFDETQWGGPGALTLAIDARRASNPSEHTTIYLPK